MALLGREFIAVPDEHKNVIIYKWPDVSIRKNSKAIVNADEMALFVNTGQIVATLGPGRHNIDADEIRGLGMFIDAATAGRAYRAELYFVHTREFTGNTFGGRIDDVQDPQTGLIVTLRVFGDYAVQILDPVAMIMNLIGTVNLASNEAVTGWVSEQLLKVMRTDVTTQVVRNGWPILGLSVYTPDVEAAVVVKANEQLASYGVKITRMGNFDINLAPEDAEQLKTLAKDTSYSRLAGSFNQYATGAMQIGAGEGMAQGGAGAGNAFLGVGMGMGGAMAQPQTPTPPPATGFAGGGAGFAGPPPGAAPAAAPAAPATDQVACASCSAANPAGARFCMGCGQPLAPRTVHCTNCGTELNAGAKFCMNCGTPAA
jgi:membrane protease subunit (stomatin/prohibitin family)